jgi:hypothetical protein
MDVVATIKKRVSNDFESISPRFRDWVRDHLIEPRLVRFAVDSDGLKYKDVWLVTDHVGSEDTSYRVVYDPSDGNFGLEMTTIDGIEWYMGPNGEFFETIESM